MKPVTAHIQAPGTGGPDRHTCWLATTNPDGSPHVTGIGALWADGLLLVRDRPAHPWHVYRLTPRTATALGTADPGGATRWRF